MQQVKPQQKVEMDYFDFSLHLASTPYEIREQLEQKAIEEAKKYVVKHGDKTIPGAGTLADRYVEIIFSKYKKKINETWAELLNVAPMNERTLYETVIDAYVSSEKRKFYQTEAYNRMKGIFAHKE